MATGGQKRTRSQRVAALELPPGRWERAWANLRRRDVLLRIGLCLLTAVALCAVIRGWQPPFAYRAGDVPQHDVVARVPFSVSEGSAADGNLVMSYQPGQTLAASGEPLDEDKTRLLETEHKAAVAEMAVTAKLLRAAAVIGVILTLFGVCALYVQSRQRRLLVNLRRLATMQVLAVLAVAAACWAADPWRAEIVPLLIFAQTVAIAYRQEMALLFSGVLALVVVLGLGGGLASLLLLLGVTTAAVLQLGRIRNRSKLIYVGFLAGVLAFLLSFVVALLDMRPVGWSLLAEAGRYGLWTLAAGFLMTGLLPFIERLFGVLTDISLLELADVSQGLLQELVQRAPSTYNHSITVGSIAEAAADAIGARGLLVRVGACFHDIGKMLKPEYFVENQPPDANRHESLIPAMSTLVIIAHVKDGADLARKHKLPEAIIDFIEQHHGTTLVEYFYGRASEQSENDPNGGEVDESNFRYPGPKPQTKETAVLMLADAVESACRSLVDPAPARIESLVREVAERRLDDGQFDESNLTLRELRTIEDSMVKSLIANYHGRVKYPGQRTA